MFLALRIVKILAIHGFKPFESSLAGKRNRLTALSWNFPDLIVRPGMEIDPVAVVRPARHVGAARIAWPAGEFLLLQLGQAKCRASRMAAGSQRRSILRRETSAAFPRTPRETSTAAGRSRRFVRSRSRGSRSAASQTQSTLRPGRTEAYHRALWMQSAGIAGAAEVFGVRPSSARRKVSCQMLCSSAQCTYAIRLPRMLTSLISGPSAAARAGCVTEPLTRSISANLPSQEYTSARPSAVQVRSGPRLRRKFARTTSRPLADHNDFHVITPES